jgi:PAS domain S-box-containing protein
MRTLMTSVPEHDDAAELEHLRRAYDGLKQSMEELTALRASSKEILASSQASEICQLLIEAVLGLVPARGVELYLFDAAGTALVGTGGAQAGRLKPDAATLEWIMNAEKPSSVPREDGTVVTLVPLVVYGERVGVLCLDVTGREEALSAHGIELLTELGTSAAVALSNSKLVARVEQQFLLLNNILDSITNGIVTVDPRLAVTRVNRNAMAMLEIAEDPTDRALLEILPAELRPAVQGIVEETLQMGFAIERMAAHKLSTGPEIPLAISTSLMRDPDLSVRGINIVFRDMTASKELERLRRLDQMKSEFVANVSHELKTPLTSIKAYTEAVIDMVEGLKAKLDGVAGAAEELQQQKDFLKVVDEESDRLLFLINDLLNVARIQAGKLKLNLEKVNPHLLVTEILGLSKVTSEKHQLITELAPDCPPMVLDKEKMKEVTINLVSNAIKYSPTGGRVWVRMNVVENNLRIAVQDEGIGISKEDQPKVFEQFYRVDSSLTSAVPGTGLGLSIVQAIVEAHGGKVELESEPGKGSTFTVWLPVRTEWKPQFDLETTFVD